MARIVALAGATGLVGRELLKGLVADPSVAAIHVLGRRALEAPPAKVHAQVVDFRSRPARAARAWSARWARARSRGSSTAA